MRILKIVALVLASLVVLLAIVGFLLPGTYRVERAVEINATAEKIFPLLEDPKAWKQWSAWNQRDPAMKVTYSGAASGTGAKWSWESATEGSGEMTFTRVDAPRVLEYKLWFPEFQSGSIGALVLEPNGQRVRLVWRNEGKMDAKPIGGYLALVMDRMVGPDFEAGLKILKAIAERS